MIKEINTFFNSLVAYLVIIVFLTFIGLYTWMFPDTSVIASGYADMLTLFQFGPVAFLLLIPAITMKTFAEERKDGTLELLLTHPVSDWDIVLGKYFACILLVLFSLLPTVFYYFSIYRLGDPVGNIDSAAVVTSYVGLMLLGSVFASIGVLTSVTTKNQVIAFILCLLICYILYDGLTRIATLPLWKGSAGFFVQLSLGYHYDALSRGMIDSRDVIYFVSIIVISLILTHKLLGSRRW